MDLRCLVLWLSVSFLHASILCQGVSQAQIESTPDDSTQLIMLPSFSADVVVEAMVDSSRVPFNRNLTLTIKVSCTGDISRYEFQWPNPPDIDRFDIVGSSSANVVSDEGGQRVTVKEFRYILKPVGEGQGRIGPITLFYTDKKSQRDYSLSTRALRVEITEPLTGGSAGVAATLFVPVGLVIVLLAGGAFFYLRKMRGRKEIEVPQQEVKSPEETALEELETVPELRLAGEIKEYYSAISNTLRRYIDRKYALRTVELTTHDIVGNLRLKEVAQEVIAGIEQILNICDMVKFARHEPPPADLDRILSMAHNFFTSRMHVPPAEVQEEKEDTLP
ncbi:MAG: hypothetical protein JSV84_15800 [Gemmatimonadota bacterium]|nr:MAG: hypothetical protein JSV84_15800 [Gemmatimonadota bacterium]